MGLYNRFISINFTLTMIAFPDKKKLQLQVIYTSIGKLPKIGGSYLSTRKPPKSFNIQPKKQSRKGITSVDIESAKKRLYFELKRNSLREHRNYSQNIVRQRIVTEPSSKDYSMQRKKQSHKLDPLNFLSPRRMYQKAYTHKFKYCQLQDNETQEQKQQLKSFAVNKSSLIESDHYTIPNKYLLNHPRVKFNECEIDQVDLGPATPSKVRLEPLEKPTSRYMANERIEKTLMTNRRNSLIERLKKKYSESSEVQLPHIKQQNLMKDQNLFKRYQEARQDYYRCYTQQVQQKLRRY